MQLTSIKEGTEQLHSILHCEVELSEVVKTCQSQVSMNMGQHSLFKHTWAAVFTLAPEGLGELPEGRDVQEPEQASPSISVEMPLEARESWSHSRYCTLSLRAALTLSTLADSKKGVPVQTKKSYHKLNKRKIRPS